MPGLSGDLAALPARWGRCAVGRPVDVCRSVRNAVHSHCAGSGCSAFGDPTADPVPTVDRSMRPQPLRLALLPLRLHPRFHQHRPPRLRRPHHHRRRRRQMGRERRALEQSNFASLVVLPFPTKPAQRSSFLSTSQYRRAAESGLQAITFRSPGMRRERLAGELRHQMERWG